MCKILFLDFGHHLNDKIYIKNRTFQNLDSVSVFKWGEGEERTENLSSLTHTQTVLSEGSAS
jgi:hypothetical protein